MIGVGPRVPLGGAYRHQAQTDDASAIARRPA